MTRTEGFENAYKQLNVRQREAVDAIEGSVMVVAGPGTGKTQILALRIARILEKTDTPPDGILALTFTDKAAKEMLMRVVVEHTESETVVVTVYKTSQMERYMKEVQR